MKLLGALAHSSKDPTRVIYAASWKRSPGWAAWHSLSFLNVLIPVTVNYLLEALRRCLAWPGLGLVAAFFLSLVAGLIKSFSHVLHVWGASSCLEPYCSIRCNRRGAGPQKILSTVFKLRLEHRYPLRSDQCALDVCKIRWKQRRNSGCGPAPTVCREVGLLDIRVTWEFLCCRLRVVLRTYGTLSFLYFLRSFNMGCDKSCCHLPLP